MAPSQDRPLLVELAGGERRPDPDPTVLTTQAVERASEQWRRDLSSLRTYLEQKIDDLRELKAAHFADVHRRLDTMEKQRIEHAAESNRTASTWIEMQQRAIDKSEKGFADQLSQLDKAQDTSTNDLRRAIEDVKQRITAVEQQKIGAKDNTAWIAAIAAVFIGMLAIMGWVASHNGSQQAPISVTPSSGPRVEVK